jgi:hypothetical protein
MSGCWKLDGLLQVKEKYQINILAFPTRKIRLFQNTDSIKNIMRFSAPVGGDGCE